MRHPNLAVVHDHFNIRGGGERLTIILAKALAADLVFSQRSPKQYSNADFSGLKIYDLRAQEPKFGSKILYLIRTFRRRTQFISRYDAVVYSGDFAPFAAINHPGPGNLFYCHTPPRIIYDQQKQILTKSKALQRIGLYLLTQYLKPSYRTIMECMDIVVANSINVRDRIRRYWNRDAEVVYPPCEVERFNWLTKGTYYLSTARLEPFKRVDIIVEAFKSMPDKQLIIASGGTELEALKQKATGAENISFTGWISDQQMEMLVGNAIATIYTPIEEDFGMSPVESMAAGKPVIGVSAGGLLESVEDEKTGVLLPETLSVKALVDAVTGMTPERALDMREACERRAHRFSREAFLESMERLVYGMLS